MNSNKTIIEYIFVVHYFEHFFYNNFWSSILNPFFVYLYIHQRPYICFLVFGPFLYTKQLF